MKAHKDPGAVVPRVVHGCGSYPFEGLGKWVSRRIRLLLKDMGDQHLVTSTTQFKEEAEKVELSLCIVLAKMDIKDFFLTGKASALLQAVFGDSIKTLNASRRLLHDVLEF